MLQQGQDTPGNTKTQSHLTSDSFEHETSNDSSFDSGDLCMTEAVQIEQRNHSHSIESPYKQTTTFSQPLENNVVSLFADSRDVCQADSSIVQVYPETSGIKMLYSNDGSSRCVAVPIICWALRADGKICAMVPWLNEVLDCETIAEKFDLSWEGFYDQNTEEVFDAPPGYAVAMLTTAARFKRELASAESKDERYIVYEFADQIGTHAMQLNKESQSLTLISVISWQLDSKGQLHGMLTDESAAQKYPVLPGDDCLYPAQENAYFRCFFQRDIAEQIRERDPETLSAIERLFLAEEDC